jgi:hypothetical protein
LLGGGVTRFVAVGAVLAALALSACARQTNPPIEVGPTAATLTGQAGCAGGLVGRSAWQWRELGTAAWATGGQVTFDCRDKRNALTPITHRLTGLKPDTSYQYRLTVDLGTRCEKGAPSTCVDSAHLDSAGTAGGTSYDRLTTQPVCDDVQGASETLAAFVAANPAGTQADPRILCVRAGTQSIGQLNGLKAWSTLTPRGEADGTKQTAVLNGNVGLDNRGASLEDVKVVGCYYQAGCGTQRNKVVDVKTDDVALRHVEITQRGGRNADAIQCILVSGDRQLTGFRVEYSKVHSCGSESSGNMQHGLYCSDALAPRVTGSWFYDNEGFGIQVYPNCDGLQAVGNVVAENGAACEFSGVSSSRMSTGSEYRNGFCGYGRETGFAPPIHCGHTSGNRSTDMVVFTQARFGHTDCNGTELLSTGTLQADPQFVNGPGFDFRMRSPAARAKLGVYAEILPGPRW